MLLSFHLKYMHLCPYRHPIILFVLLIQNTNHYSHILYITYGAEDNKMTKQMLFGATLSIPLNSKYHHSIKILSKTVYQPLCQYTEPGWHIPLISGLIRAIYSMILLFRGRNS